MTGAIEFLKELKNYNIPIFVVSGSEQKGEGGIENESEILNLRSYFKRVFGYGGDIYPYSKMAAFEWIKREFNIEDNSQILVGGDGKNEIGVGKSQGAITMGLLNLKNVTREILVGSGADYIVHDSKDLVRCLRLIHISSSPVAGNGMLRDVTKSSLMFLNVATSRNLTEPQETLRNITKISSSPLNFLNFDSHKDLYHYPEIEPASWLYHAQKDKLVSDIYHTYPPEMICADLDYVEDWYSFNSLLKNTNFSLYGLPDIVRGPSLVSLSADYFSNNTFPYIWGTEETIEEKMSFIVQRLNKIRINIKAILFIHDYSPTAREYTHKEMILLIEQIVKERIKRLKNIETIEYVVFGQHDEVYYWLRDVFVLSQRKTKRNSSSPVTKSDRA